MYSSSFQQCKLRSCSRNWKLFLQKGGHEGKINCKWLIYSRLEESGSCNLYVQGFLFAELCGRQG
jgi:hypothetical protein